jgi:hypothetical protein
MANYLLRAGLPLLCTSGTNGELIDLFRNSGTYFAQRIGNNAARR